jgi:iron(III) transport system substrate-binding protein
MSAARKAARNAMPRTARLAGQIATGLVLTALVSTACSSDPSRSGSKTLTLYTCATEKIEQSVIAAFEKDHSGSKVEVFRAPTGQLNARVAADARSGGIRADVIWACDPVTMNGYDEQGLLADWMPASGNDIGSGYRTSRFTGVDLLYLVAVTHKGVPAPASWSDLTGPAYHNGVALPSPTFAASALGMLGYFVNAAGYGMDYYKALKANGAKQLNSPDDVLTGVAQGTYKAGFVLANSAYAAKQKGSPIEVTWPKPGAVAIYAPIGVTTKKSLSPLARDFANFVASRTGQSVVGKSGAYSVLTDVSGPPMPAGSPVVSPTWSTVFGQAKDLLARYGTIFKS